MIAIKVNEISNLDEIIQRWENGELDIPDQTIAEVVVNADQIICAERREFMPGGTVTIRYTKISLTDGLVVNCLEDWPEIGAGIIESKRAIEGRL